MMQNIHGDFHEGSNMPARNNSLEIKDNELHRRGKFKCSLSGLNARTVHGRYSVRNLLLTGDSRRIIAM